MSSILLFFIAATLTLVGCENVQQRPDKTSCRELSATSSACGTSSFLTLDAKDQEGSPILAFVEFDDNGAPYDQLNIDNVFKRIEDINSADDQSLLMVVFIHGWHHNAAQTDRNVIEFKSFLESLNKEEKALSVGRPRKVVGIYMGWQGKASDNPIVRLFSYRDKKELGLETGMKSVTPILKRLSVIRESDKNNRLIFAGHSFGGGVLYSAVMDDLLERLKNPTSRSVKLFGDLTILLNPAVEAQRFVAIHEVLNKDFPECTPLSMVSLTSEADTALSKEFPRGMELFYRDQLKGDPSDVLLTTAYGRYAEFSKYELRPDTDSAIEDSLSKDVFNSAVPTWSAFRSTMSAFNLGGIKLTHMVSSTPQFAWEPVLNVFVDKSLIQEHNEIWDPKVKYFLRGLIGMEFAKARQCK